MRTKTRYKFLDSPLPHLIAHRGGNGAGIERQNTIAAFESAVDLGYEYIETDVVASKDGKAVVFHGSFSARQEKTTGLIRRRSIQTMSYDYIKKNLSAGGEKIPLLEDVLAAFPAIKFNIDAKTFSSIVPFADAVKRTNSKDRICVASFSHARASAVALLLGGKGKVCTSVGMWGFGSILARSRMKQKVIEEYLKKKKVGCLQIPYHFVTAELIDTAHKAGVAVHTWVVNDARTMKLLLDMGVDGLITDETELLVKTARSK